MKLVRTLVLLPILAQGLSSVWSLTLKPHFEVLHVLVLRAPWQAMVALVKLVNFSYITFFLSNACSTPFPFLVNAKPQCESDFDCNFDQKCAQGTCVSACSLVSCGVNALCLPKNHRGICECIPGYFGNPSIACNKGMFQFLM